MEVEAVDYEGEHLERCQSCCLERPIAYLTYVVLNPTKPKRAVAILIFTLTMLKVIRVESIDWQEG